MRKVADVEEVRAYLAEQMAKHWPADHPHPHIISKIENTEAREYGHESFRRDPSPRG